MRIFLLLSFVVLSFGLKSQVKIKLTPQNGVYSIPGKINGSSKNFIFDTGASLVTVSLNYFQEALRSGVLKQSDVLPQVMNFQIANGEIVEGSLINIRLFTIGTLEIKNVLATVIPSQSEDFLLGQSVLQRFGAYTIDNVKNELVIESIGKDVVSDLQKDYMNKGKELGWPEATTKGTYGQHIQTGNNAIEFCKSVEFEFYKINVRNKQDGELQFEFDITNNSSIDIGNSAYGLVYVVVEVITTDGKTYSDSKPLGISIPSGNTVEGPKLSLKIRDKQPKFIRAYCKYYSITLNKYY